MRCVRAFQGDGLARRLTPAERITVEDERVELGRALESAIASSRRALAARDGRVAITIQFVTTV